MTKLESSNQARSSKEEVRNEQAAVGASADDIAGDFFVSTFEFRHSDLIRGFELLNSDFGANGRYK